MAPIFPHYLHWRKCSLSHLSCGCAELRVCIYGELVEIILGLESSTAVGRRRLSGGRSTATVRPDQASLSRNPAAGFGFVGCTRSLARRCCAHINTHTLPKTHPPPPPPHRSEFCPIGRALCYVLALQKILSKVRATRHTHTHAHADIAHAPLLNGELVIIA